MSHSNYEYQGGELELFASASRWKTYFASRLAPHLRGRIVESGAGLGANTPFLLPISDAESWLCLEPDAGNHSALEERVARFNDHRVSVRKATVPDLPQESAETILYLDVLEHIEDDAAELRAAASRIVVGGKIVVLAPAHQSLFSEFDRAIGHQRRYSRDSLLRLTPKNCRAIESYYLDSVGLFASMANRFLLKQGTPTAKQIAFWDKCLVTSSRFVDPLVMRRLGKSVVVVWMRES